MQSVAYSPDGRHIISGSDNRTIRIWDAETGAAIGSPLEGHAGSVQSVAYSPNGCHIISGTSNCAIRIWDAETGDAVSNPLEGHAGSVVSVVYSPDGQHIVSGSYDGTTRVWDSFPYVPTRLPSCNSIHTRLCAMPDMDGWVRDSEGGLLYWVPHDICRSVHSPALLTIPLLSCNRSVSLDFDDFAFGTLWAQIFKSADI